MVSRLAGTLLDLTVFGAFTRPGFRVRSRRWKPDASSSLAGRTFAVTGAASGIGLATAGALASRGASVHLLCRSAARGAAARDALAAAHPAARVVLHEVDVSLLSSVRGWARRFTRSGAPLHGLVHNAGVLPATRTETREGIETAFATNVLGPFVLTHELTSALAAAGDARVVFVSSGGMLPVGLRLDDLQWTKRRWDGVRAYAETKRAEVVLARLFSERRDPGSRVTFHSMHPGWVDTRALQEALPRFHRFWRPWLRTPAEGADTVTWLLTTREPIGSGAFWFDRLPRRTRLAWRRDPVSSADAGALWAACESLSAAVNDSPARRSA